LRTEGPPAPPGPADRLHRRARPAALRSRAELRRRVTRRREPLVSIDHITSAPQSPAVPVNTGSDIATELGVVEPAGTALRTYVLDTSVLLSDPRAMLRFAEHDVVLPVVVVTELEAKRHHSELGYFARS